ncbi:zinc finger protein CONSTANS-LIKE 13-like [Typha angustifolia]|uniref:zinc finger protein CONSTANS-LIKE 13-like n=1 Tax=Typha angustifolia TaxID=59011 RepID=UPI003C2BE43F
MVQEEAPAPPKVEFCDFCSQEKALVYCRADTAKLCLRCDRQVHAANSVSSRHPRSLLCDSCRAAPASVFCASDCNLVLCSNCDFDAHPKAEVCHGRRPVEGFSGCPTAIELISVLGIGEDEKDVGTKFGSDGYRWEDEEEGLGLVWETPPMFSLSDLIVNTTPCHGFQAMGLPPLPKHRNSSCGKHKEEILQQLRELLKSENIMYNPCEEIEPVTEFQVQEQHDLQPGNLDLDADEDATNIVTPTYENCGAQWNPTECRGETDTFDLEFSYGQCLLSSSAANLSPLVEMADICGSASHRSCIDKEQGQSVEETVPSLPSKDVYDLPCPDRDSVISRYREKRKTRRYDKLIRYESRKARADNRLRVKGRFAKVDHANQS